jgi:hypothetical protein
LNGEREDEDYFPTTIANADATLAVIQPLSSVLLIPKQLSTDPDPSSPLQMMEGFYKAIKSKSFRLDWNSSAPSSVVSTYRKCTPNTTPKDPSTPGVYRGWDGATNSLDWFGITRDGDVMTEKDVIYRLTCQNIYQGDSRCYTEKAASINVYPFGTDIQETTSWLERIRDIFLTTRVNRGLAGGE